MQSARAQVSTVSPEGTRGTGHPFHPMVPRDQCPPQRGFLSILPLGPCPQHWWHQPFSHLLTSCLSLCKVSALITTAFLCSSGFCREAEAGYSELHRRGLVDISHMITEAEKSHTLPSASRGPGRLVVTLSPGQRPENKEAGVRGLEEVADPAQQSERVGFLCLSSLLAVGIGRCTPARLRARFSVYGVGVSGTPLPSQTDT